MKAPNLSADICGVRLKNPTVLASGILGLTGDILARVGRIGAGAVTSKSCSLKPRQGYPNPVVLDWGPGLINTVGLANPGLEAMVHELRRAKEELEPAGVPVIASIYGGTIADFEKIAKRISEAKPELIEVNISCPNLRSESKTMFSAHRRSADRVIRRVKQATSIPIIVKLSPNVARIDDIAQAVEQAGADAISAINTVGPGMVIDVESGMPILSHGTGSLSGPAIRPLAVRCIYDICRVVQVPVIGIGGVTSGRDAVEMIMAGASAVGIGSGVHYRGLDIFKLVCDEMRDFMANHGYKSIDDFRGLTQARWEAPEDVTRSISHPIRYPRKHLGGHLRTRG